jgi:hypothetical protein
LVKSTYKFYDTRAAKEGNNVKPTVGPKRLGKLILDSNKELRRINPNPFLHLLHMGWRNFFSAVLERFVQPRLCWCNTQNLGIWRGQTMVR